ncbi:LOW QUALITY PROTEIN: probable E3 SUMO-protein ligase RNF212 [Notamacropus eugenii]|uniref:LOW QUALITY PROTEIN: probable E3 SUMO-protein ligase RNF212 n=1 Tax=Notamacropus eugenii TaxID=9315 RepID=UPI003B6766F6
MILKRCLIYLFTKLGRNGRAFIVSLFQLNFHPLHSSVGTSQPLASLPQGGGQRSVVRRRSKGSCLFPSICPEPGRHWPLCVSRGLRPRLPGMAVRMFCNRCFQPPGKSSLQFSMTSCGHVFCHLCLQQGKKEECLVCRTPCRIILLSKQTDFNIQALFMGIDGLCKKYSKETSQILEFQEKHRRRLLTFYREKISKLEESLKTLTQQIQQIQSKGPSQQTMQLSLSKPVKTSVSTSSAKPAGYSSYSFLPAYSSTSQIMESMDIDLSPSPMRKLDTPAGPARLSLISPPQDGRMGCVSYRGPQLLGLTSSQNCVSRTPPSQIPHNGPSHILSSSLQSRIGMWDTSGLRIPQFTPPPSQSSVPRQPISISNLLQRQCLGSTRGGSTLGR